jgi:hypothetical protein
MFDFSKTMMNPLFLGGASLLSGEGMGGAARGMAMGSALQQRQQEQDDAEKRRQQFLGLLQSPEIMKINPGLLKVAQAAGPDAGLRMLASEMDPATLLERRRAEEELNLMPLKRKKMERELAQPTGSADLPSAVREYEYVKGLSPEDQQRYLSVKRANPLDKVYATQYGTDVLQGGNVDTTKNMSQLKDVQTRLESGKENLTGPVLGMMPDSVKAYTNPAAVDAKNTVEEVVQRNLRAILGGQFAAKEGEQLIARAYNPSLPEAENAKRLGRLYTAMDEALKQKQAAASYFQENGTMRGFQGKTQFSVSDFEKAMEGNTDTQLPTIFDPSQARGLPSGTRFRTPDGRVMEVP